MRILILANGMDDLELRMIFKIKSFLRNPRQRMQAETIASGTLIILGLLAGYLLHLDAFHNALMFAAALIAGAGRALADCPRRFPGVFMP